MKIVYAFVCSHCGRAYPVTHTDPSEAPICCGVKMDAFPQEATYYVEVKSYG